MDQLFNEPGVFEHQKNEPEESDILKVLSISIGDTSINLYNAHTTKRGSKCPKKVCKSMNESDDLAHTLF